MSTETTLVTSTKRARSEEQADDDTSKKRRVSSEEQQHAEVDTHTIPDERGEQSNKADSPNEEKKSRKPARMDEKQRSRRLFGSLLGTLVKPVDKTIKRRQEIEDRRKAELRKQDEETRVVRRPADAAPQTIQKRREEQVKVDEDDMRMRHRSMRHSANFLKTQARPVLHYRPWELRASEKETIETQCQRVEDQIDDDLDEFESRRTRTQTSVAPVQPSTGRASPEGRDVERPAQTKPPDNEENSTDAGAEDPSRLSQAAHSTEASGKVETDTAMAEAPTVSDAMGKSNTEQQLKGDTEMEEDGPANHDAQATMSEETPVEHQKHETVLDDVPSNAQEEDVALEDVPINHQEEDTVLY